jgi:hypothetical protein
LNNAVEQTHVAGSAGGGGACSGVGFLFGGHCGLPDVGWEREQHWAYSAAGAASAVAESVPRRAFNSSVF